MAAITQLQLGGWGGKRYGSFADKSTEVETFGAYLCWHTGEVMLHGMKSGDVFKHGVQQGDAMRHGIQVGERTC